MWLANRMFFFCTRADIPGGSALEAVEVVPGEDEVSLLPPREELVSLLPEEALLLVIGGGRGGGRRQVHVKGGLQKKATKKDVMWGEIVGFSRFFFLSTIFG